MKYRTILFDIDGTLLDSKELVLQGYEAALSARGYSMPRETLTRILGLTLEDGYRELLPEEESLHPELIHTHKQHSIKNIDLIKTFPRMEEVLSELKTRGFQLAAVTNRKPWVGVDIFSNTSLGEYIDLLVTANDVVNPKPHPEPILLALNKLQSQPARAMMVGDSDSDIRAGKAAGVTTVGATYGMFGHSIQDHQPDHLIHALHELLDLL